MPEKKKFRDYLSKRTVERKKLYVFIAISISMLVLHGILMLLNSEADFEVAVICGLLYFASLPILSILFGIYSYKFTERIIFPHLCLFFSYEIFFGGVIFRILRRMNKQIYSILDILDALPLAAIVTGISLITALITMWDCRSYEKSKKKNASNTPPSSESSDQ